jgi:hypothetical protein
MKRISTSLLIILILISCKNDRPLERLEATESVNEISYLKNLAKVFEAHGGLDVWRSMNSLSFGIQRPKGLETTLTQLKSRYSLIEAPSYKLGYDGKTLWLKETDTIPYNGNARFYNGLMFYFYAMPFVLADEGILYAKAEPLTHDGTTYPGILISYNSGVGASPEDQYILYYHPETFQMSWLAYTVTFGKDQKSLDFRYIEYHDWQTLNGLKLPKAITWYQMQDGLPTEKRNTLEFVDVFLSPEVPDTELFQAAEGSKIIK